MGKRHNKISIGSSTNVKNEPPFKKKQFTPMQADQSDMYDIPLKTVLDDQPPQVTPATMNDTTSLQMTADSPLRFDTALPRIHTVNSSDDEEILNDETALDISQITCDLDPELNLMKQTVTYLTWRTSYQRWKSTRNYLLKLKRNHQT